MSSRPDPLEGAEDEDEEPDDGYVEAEDEDFAASEEDGGDDDSDADEGGGKRKRRKGDGGEGGKKRASKRLRGHADANLGELYANTDGGVDADELADLEAERLAVYGAEVVRGSRAAGNVPSAALDALWEDMVAEDAAYVGFKMAAVSRGLAGIGATHLTASSAAGAVAAEQAAAAPPTAALRRVTVPGFGQRRSGGSSGDGDDHGAAAGGATSGNSRPPPPGAIAPTVSATADLLLRNGVRGSVADPILSGPTCVPTGGGSVAGTSSSLPPAAAGRRSAAVLAAMLAPIRAPVDGRLRPAAAAGGGGASAPEIPLALLEAAAAAKAVAANKKVAVTQTVKFAGKTMTVTRLVTPGTAAAKAIAEEAAASAARAAISAASAAGEGAGGGDASTAAASGAGASAGAGGSVSLDALVANLDKPEAISTLTKSSLDWDTYKHAHGLDDELERAAKAGFVEKQAFLARVDERRFEVEREARAKERSRAEMEAMRAAAGRR